MRCLSVGLLSLACLPALGRAKGAAKGATKGGANKTNKTEPPKEKEAATSWQVSQFESNLTVAPQGGNFVIVPKEYSNDVQVYQCDGPPCLPSKLAASKEPANVSVDLYQGYGKFKIWIPEVPDDYKWSLGWKITFGLDPRFEQRIYKAEVNGQDVLWKIAEGELNLDPSEGGQSIDVEVLSLKSGAFSKCAWDGEGCFEGKCCKSGGMTCYLKDDYWGMCRPTGTCTPGKDEADGQEWACTDVGGKPDVDPLPPATEEDKAGTSLFCFVVSTPLTYEEDLVGAQKEAGAGVFGCDESAAYTGAEADPETEAMVLKDWLAIWDEVMQDGLWKKTDWTVKAEADAVFSPARLRSRLGELSPWGGVPIYFKSTKEGAGLPVPFMLFSNKAVETLLNDDQDCKGKVERRKGESFYLATCLDASGAGHMLDEGLIDDKRSGKEHAWDLTDTSDCSGEGVVAYRPFQQAAPWLECSQKAEQAAARLLRDRL